MLLPVEGGGLFSSSVLGYSKGLTTLLLLGKKPKEKPMRVAPWNHYQLVDSDSNLHDSDSDSGLHLASDKNRIIRGCASFLCFGRAAAGLESPRPLKVGPTHNHPQDPFKSPDLKKVKEKVFHSNLDDENDDNVIGRNSCSLRSSLKRPTRTISVNVVVNNESIEGKMVKRNERRVQWTDVSGGELEMVREFEPSEHGESDDELENWNERSCSCKLM